EIPGVPELLHRRDDVGARGSLGLIDKSLGIGMPLVRFGRGLSVPRLPDEGVRLTWLDAIIAAATRGDRCLKCGDRRVELSVGELLAAVLELASRGFFASGALSLRFSLPRRYFESLGQRGSRRFRRSCPCRGRSFGNTGLRRRG